MPRPPVRLGVPSNSGLTEPVADASSAPRCDRPRRRTGRTWTAGGSRWRLRL